MEAVPCTHMEAAFGFRKGQNQPKESRLHADHLSELRKALDKAMAEVKMGGEKPGTDGGQD